MAPQHFLVATFPAQGHINPALHLAKRLARTTGAHVTFSTSISGHRRMFPSDVVDDGLITYLPFSDGYDDGFNHGTDDSKHYMSQFKSVGSHTLAAIAGDLAARGRPVSCIIYSLLLPWAAEVARAMAIPSALYWIQPATVFAIYYHYFHGYDELISAHSKEPRFTVNLPGLPALQIRELPSFFTATDPNSPYTVVLATFKEVFETLDKESEEGQRPKVLINTYEALEVDAIAAVDTMDLIPIGPLLPSTLMGDDEGSNDAGSGGDLFKPDEKAYMEWLHSKAEGSVVYVSFGSLSVLRKRQVEEISHGLEGCGRPYLWVLRKDSRWEEMEVGEGGMVVEWCSQLKVLSHHSVGCFVTHCGWNSTLESLACGVPMVAVPQWTDQGTNARLVETAWGTGVRGEVDGEGVMERKELQRCLEVVMGEGERGTEIRKKAATWRDRAIEAVRIGGSSHRNLKDFVEKISRD